MSSCKLLLFRMFNKTLGRFRFFSWMLKRRAIKSMIKKKPYGDRYTASSRYFVMAQLGEGKK